MKRKKISKDIKDMVWRRQCGGCALCIERGEHYHHVVPVAMGGENQSRNIVFLCKEHHNLLHLGDLDTCLSILEYSYFIKYGKLPYDIEEIKDLANIIKKEYSRNI